MVFETRGGLISELTTFLDEPPALWYRLPGDRAGWERAERS
jgi:hypothetical protein